MDSLKPYRFVLALAAVCLALPAVALGARLPQSTAAPAAPASNSVTFTDSTGEDPAAPDITTIVVSNDDSGTITFRINIPNRPQFGVSDMRLLMWLDTDGNQSTGDPNSLGAEYVIVLFGGEAILGKWDPTTSGYIIASTQSTLSYSWSGGATIKINASDLANTRGFNFGVFVESGLVIDTTTGNIDETNAHSDQAPTIGFYPYQVKVGTPKLVVKSFTHRPARPTSGKTFTLRLTAARSDTGAVLQGGTVVCVGRAGTTRLTAIVHRVAAGAATCTFRIPKTAKGKTFRGSDTVVFEGQKATRSFSGKIR